MSQVRQNYDDECEALVNRQINLELYASYVYMSMGAYFSRDDVALHGFAKWFNESSDEERTHAKKLVDYQNTRGGKVLFKDVSKPNVDNWKSALDAMEAALKLEKSVNQSLLEIHSVASNKTDPQFCDFLESEYLKEQVESIKYIGDLVTRMKRAGDGVGLYLLDQELLKSS